jgi:hypothetical protein
MKDRPQLVSRIVLAALATGVTGDLLLRSEPWGLNLALCALLLIAAGLALAAGDGIALGADARWLMGAAAAFSGFFLWRGSPSLLALDLLAAAGALTLATLSTDGLRIRRAGLYQYVLAGLLTAVDVARSFPELATRQARAPLVGRTLARRQARAGAVGLLLAVPILLMFGGLLTAADAVFDQMVTRAFDFDVANLFSHVVIAGLLAWLSCGLLRRMLFPRDAVVDQFLRAPRVSLGALELGLPLGLLNALFLAFVIVQLRYLFGDGSLVETTVGLTYAEYARRGFFELVAVAALVVPLLLLADWSATEGEGPARVTVRVLSVLQIALLSVIMASAIKRMLLYVENYGLTEQRLYTTAFMAGLGLLLVWFCLTVLRGRREAFAAGAVAVALHVLFVLNLLNPDALIVRVNTARAVAGGSLDAAYVGHLSADAVPELLASLDRLDADERCVVARFLLGRWGDEGHGDWRSWNAARSRAYRDVRGRRAELQALSCPSGESEATGGTVTEPGAGDGS